LLQIPVYKRGNNSSGKHRGAFEKPTELTFKKFPDYREIFCQIYFWLGVSVITSIPFKISGVAAKPVESGRQRHYRKLFIKSA
jgi:hypothetical protein